jgi:hypothetical protein
MRVEIPDQLLDRIRLRRLLRPSGWTADIFGCRYSLPDYLCDGPYRRLKLPDESVPASGKKPDYQDTQDPIPRR